MASYEDLADRGEVTDDDAHAAGLAAASYAGIYGFDVRNYLVKFMRERFPDLHAGFWAGFRQATLDHVKDAILQGSEGLVPEELVRETRWYIDRLAEVRDKYGVTA